MKLSIGWFLTHTPAPRSDCGYRSPFTASSTPHLAARRSGSEAFEFRLREAEDESRSELARLRRSAR